MREDLQKLNDHVAGSPAGASTGAGERITASARLGARRASFSRLRRSISASMAARSGLTRERLDVRVREAKLDPNDLDLNPHLQLVHVADAVVADVKDMGFTEVTREEVYLAWLTDVTEAGQLPEHEFTGKWEDRFTEKGHALTKVLAGEALAPVEEAFREIDLRHQKAKREIWAVKYPDGTWRAPDHFTSSRTPDPKEAKPFYDASGKFAAEGFQRLCPGSEVVPHPHPEVWS